jgi:hypothetical protein
MTAMRKLVNYKSVNWLLIAAILSATFLPAHYHLHHLDSKDATTHDHVIDLHLLTDAAEQSHHDADTTSFTAVPDEGVKSSSTFTPFILAALLLTVLPIIVISINVRPDFRNNNPKRTYPHFAPLLRAPPLL